MGYKSFKNLTRGFPHVRPLWHGSELAGATLIIAINSPFHARLSGPLATITSLGVSAGACALTYTIDPTMIEGLVGSVATPILLHPLWRHMWMSELRATTCIRIDHNGLHIPKFPWGWHSYPHELGIVTSITPHKRVKEEELRLARHRFEQQAKKQRRSSKKAYYALSSELRIEVAGVTVFHRAIYDPHGRKASAIAERIGFLVSYFDPSNPTSLSARTNWERGAGDL